MSDPVVDTVEQDFRLWLAQDTAIRALVDINLYFTAIPTKVTGGFIATRWPTKDGITSTGVRAGRLCEATVIVKCYFKGADPVRNYAEAKKIAQAVRTRVNTANGTWVMGKTTVYQITVDDKAEGDKNDTEIDDKFEFHDGRTGGIQSVDLGVSLHFWNPNT